MHACRSTLEDPTESVCPVYATYHTTDGLNAQVYNRCIGTRYCANNCPYNVRVFNWWEPSPSWPETLHSQLNPDVTVRSKGLIEKCTFCVQRINRVKRAARQEGRPVNDGELQPACAQSCPTDALIFGDWADPDSRLNQLKHSPREYTILEHLGTDPAVIYLKKVDPNAAEAAAAEH